MDLVAISVGVSWIFIGMLCFISGIPLMRGLVGRNPIYGARFSESFASEEAWLIINRFAGRQAIIWSIPLIAVGVAGLFLPLQTHFALTLFFGFAPLVLILIPTVNTWRFARRHGRTA